MKTEELELSEAQHLAIETVGENVCVSAGAGSGKTHVLVERFLHLVTRYEISPQAILAVTFTEKAANEMKRRIVDRLRKENLKDARREVENAPIGTIHSFASRLLREHPFEAGVDPHFVILESHEAEILQERTLDTVIETLAPDKEFFQLLRLYGEKSIREGILGLYQRSRNSETSFEGFLKRRSQADRSQLELQLKEGLDKMGAQPVRFDQIKDLLSLKSSLRAQGKQKVLIRQIQELILDLVSLIREEKDLTNREVFIRTALAFEKNYEEAKRNERALDFDDLQLKAVRLLGSDSPQAKALRKIYQGKFRGILVDEFQDTNPLQNRLIELVRKENNLFIVGDFKQSIYGFRGTDVRIFLEREKAFQKAGAGSQISLAENYRSRPALLDFINRFFEVIWKEDALPFERLKPCREGKDQTPCVERLALSEKEEESLDEMRIREARALVQRVRSLVDEEGYRYQDIALLFEAMTPVHFYEQEFRRAGIPYYVVSNRGFYHQPEVRDVMSVLTALENPKRDIPLAAALRSPFFQISDETLFWLARRAKAEERGRPLERGILDFESIPEILESEKQKLQFFRVTFNRLLQEKEKLRVAQLIEILYRLTGFDLYVLRLRQGQRHFANLRKLVELAREWESKEPLHLGDFVRSVKGLETRDIRESQAQVESEEGEVVRFLSIHMAKGLEFPVVVLPDLGRRERPETSVFSLTEEEGLGMKVWDEEKQDFQETLTYRRNKKRLDRARSEESKRVLYVAMTRAREKLIFASPRTQPEAESFHEMATWADWIERVLSEGEWEVGEVPEAPEEYFPFEKRKALAERKLIRARLEKGEPIPLREEPAEVSRLLENLIFPEKAYFKRMDIPVSAFLLFAKDPEAFFSHYEIGVREETSMISPVEVKTEEFEKTDDETLTSAEFGTRVHQILERALLRRVGLKGIEPLVLRSTQDLRPAEQKDIFDLVHRFLTGPEAKDILQAKVFHPELPFALRLPHGLVEGTLDLIYQRRNGEWVILDYKTSQVTAENFGKRAEDYRLQLELYALAVWKIMGVGPAEARIHFLRPAQTFPLHFQPADFNKLYEKFTRLQTEIIAFREKRLAL